MEFYTAWSLVTMQESSFGFIDRRSLQIAGPEYNPSQLATVALIVCAALKMDVFLNSS